MFGNRGPLCGPAVTGRTLTGLDPACGPELTRLAAAITDPMKVDINWGKNNYDWQVF